ncbi:MAG: UPF0175 family protein [Bacteroidota bacterium]
MSIIISKDVLEKIEMSAEDLLIELAIHLYQMERLSFDEARRLCRLDHWSFHKELSKRDMTVNFDFEDLET